MRCWAVAAALAAVAGFGSACSGDVVSGGPCITNRDCPTGEICLEDKCTKSTAAGTSCSADTSCAIGEFCDPVTMTCKKAEIVNCTSDDQCPPDQRCSTRRGICEAGARGCTSEAQCSAIGKHCNTMTATCQDCLDNSHCSGGKSCVGGTCVEPSQNVCSEDSDCPRPNVCQTNRCVPGCTEPGSTVVCDGSSTCDPVTGRCVSGTPAGCRGDVDCGAPRRICESMQCIAGCGEIGGLQCTGGYVCNTTTGRCEAQQSRCTSDAQCAPPATICENNQCVPGCAQAGGLACNAGTVCDGVSSGRCVPVSSPCATDPQCMPPSTVCEGSQCVPGCSSPGGIQCSGNTICNPASGRCDPSMMMLCTSDAQCNPPGMICDANSGQCRPGCGTTGCTGMDVCNSSTGRCGPQMMMPPPGAGALNATCSVNSDCASTVCFDFGGQIGARCVQSCGSSADCPAAFTCYDYTGAKMCVSSMLFQGASFATASGGRCSNAGECRSNFCPLNIPRQCVESCSEDTECGGGGCAWEDIAGGRYYASCSGPVGSLPDGASCADDTECESGACPSPAGKCSKLCGSSSSCANGEVCAHLNYSICTLPIGGLCLQYLPNFVKGCLEASHGSTPVGGPCTDWPVCRSGICHTGISQCVDLCSKDSQCPSTHRCKVLERGQLDDGTTVYFNLCMPVGS